MEKLITGIHHVTALTSDAQRNLNFYAGILGLRLVKRTVNFDAREIFHLYYGNDTGAPGTLLTFFPYQGLKEGRQGKGMLNTVAFSVPASSLDFWRQRLTRFDIPFKPLQERFGQEQYIYFEDFDGLGLELVFNDLDPRPAISTGPVPPDQAIRGIYNVEVWEEGYERTAGLLTTQLDHMQIGIQGNRFRFAATAAPGNYVDILCSPDTLRGLGGSGTVHHIAYCTRDESTQLAIRGLVLESSLDPTPVLDRKYFHSIYFREPGGVLFEVATAGPGFTVDEPSPELGNSLQLPHQFEADRAYIESRLPSLSFDMASFR